MRRKSFFSHFFWMWWAFCGTSVATPASVERGMASNLMLDILPLSEMQSLSMHVGFVHRHGVRFHNTMNGLSGVVTATDAGFCCCCCHDKQLSRRNNGRDTAASYPLLRRQATTSHELRATETKRAIQKMYVPLHRDRYDNPYFSDCL